MVDSENRENWRRERSLLALGQALRGEDVTDASLVSIGDKAKPSWREDAVARHRAARLERERRLTSQPANMDEPGLPPTDPLSQTLCAGNDWATRETYRQTGPREESRSPNFPSPAAYEPRYAEPRSASPPSRGTRLLQRRLRRRPPRRLRSRSMMPVALVSWGRWLRHCVTSCGAGRLNRSIQV